MCKSVQFGAFWGHQVIKSGMENKGFSVPILKVGRNSPSLPYIGYAAPVQGEVSMNERKLIYYWVT